jgi:GINS complex subunit 1
MNYGQHGRELLLELKRTSDPGANAPSLPPYNDVLVANALQDLSLHVQALQDQAEANSGSSKPSMEVRPSILLQNAAIQRNKRCLLAYHKVRLDRIKEDVYWKSSTSPNLSPAEQDFLDAYTCLVQGYTQAIGLEADALRANSIPPQPNDRVQVRVVNDSGFEGPIVLESGSTVVLSKGSTHYLLWSDVEEYIRAGSLVIVGGEEQEA